MDSLGPRRSIGSYLGRLTKVDALLLLAIEREATSASLLRCGLTYSQIAVRLEELREAGFFEGDSLSLSDLGRSTLELAIRSGVVRPKDEWIQELEGARRVQISPDDVFLPDRAP